MATGTLTRTLTYAQLVAEITAGTLHKGESITISDFATKHNIYDGTTVLEDIHTEVVEPLLVTAISNNTLSLQAHSVIYPTDIIYYDVNNALCEDNVTARTGKITFRKDIFGNETFYDFRGIKFRRWIFDLSGFTSWVIGEAYIKGNKIVYNNALYYCTVDIDECIDDPATLTTNFLKVVDSTNYLAWKTANHQIGADPILNNNFQIPVNSSSFKDFYTFSDFDGLQKSEWFKNVKIGNLDFDYTSLYYNSIVFVESDNLQTYNISIGNGCFFMTLGNSNYDVSIGDLTSEILLGNSNQAIDFEGRNYHFVLGSYNATIKIGKFSNTMNFGDGNIQIDMQYANGPFVFGYSNVYLNFKNHNGAFIFAYENKNMMFLSESMYLFFPSGARQNLFYDCIIGTGIDFTGATHIKGDYSCEIFKRVDGTCKLKYCNNSDTVMVVNINS